jgi:SSS family solute:Na+ symporter
VLFGSTILLYVVALLGVAIWKSRATKTHDDFVVAGRAVPVPLLVGTLVCTWIGSGSLFGGAGLAYRTGIAELWFSFGAWVGLLAVYFLAGRVRRIAQYTVPDLLEQRYNAAARVLGTLAIILAYVTIAAYQFRGGGWILSIVTDGRISPVAGMYLTAATIVAFTAFAGMVSIVTVDIFNGVLITLGVLVALPYTVWQLGGIGAVAARLPPAHLQPLGGHNALWAAGVALPTFLLLLGESGMYQKFFSAKDEKAARRAVIGMIVGVVTIETTLALVAIVGRAAYPDLLERTSVVGRAASETIVLYTARHGLPAALGALLLAAAVAIVLSTGNTFLLVPSTNLSRDLFQRFVRPDASERSKLLVQRAGIRPAGPAAPHPVRDRAGDGPLRLLPGRRQPDPRPAGRLPVEARHRARRCRLYRRWLADHRRPAGPGSRRGELRPQHRRKPVRLRQLRLHRDPGCDRLGRPAGRGEPAHQALAPREVEALHGLAGAVRRSGPPTVPTRAPAARRRSASPARRGAWQGDGVPWGSMAA